MANETNLDDAFFFFFKSLLFNFCHARPSLCSFYFSQAKDKEERLLKRQQNRERMEEKRKQKAVLTEEQGIFLTRD